jgi:hypothetical protein
MLDCKRVIMSGVQLWLVRRDVDNQKFGEGTRDAVQAFQANNKLEVTGKRTLKR